MPTFDKLRISLTRDEPGPLLEAAGVPDEPISRSDYFAGAFAEPLSFVSTNGAVYRFHPIDAPKGYVSGLFSRDSPHQLKHADLTPYTAENYETSLFLMKVDKQQIAWMEYNQKVGATKRILESFFEHILKKTSLKDWMAFVRYFDSEQGYWQAVEAHRQEITKIIFRYVPPNAFEGKKLAQRYHTAVQEEARNEQLEETFRSAPGRMNPESEMMKANAEIAAQGAGERELRGPKNKLLYRSGQQRVTEQVEEGDMPDPQNPGFLRRVITRLFG